MQWGVWGEWSEWTPTCFDNSADSIYKDSSKYYPKRSRTRDCTLTENSFTTILAIDDSDNCPFTDSLEKETDQNYATECFRKSSF